MKNYKEIIQDKNNIVVRGITNFELKDVFDCGQAFRWRETEHGSYIGVAHKRVIEVAKKENDLIIYDCSVKEFEETWNRYLDLDRDYGAIIDSLQNDEVLCTASKFGKGVRILKQESFEILISFIISANNQIPRIKKSIDRISRRWGRKILYKGEEYYTFPTVEEMREAEIEDIEQCGVGFRAKYIYAAIQKVMDDETILKRIEALDDDMCHKELMEFKGVGPKVADCIMLFSMAKYSAFPVDVWIKRAMMYFYDASDMSLPKMRKFAREKFGNLAGFAQQYLFYYARENNIKI